MYCSSYMYMAWAYRIISYYARIDLYIRTCSDIPFSFRGSKSSPSLSVSHLISTLTSFRSILVLVSRLRRIDADTRDCAAIYIAHA